MTTATQTQAPALKSEKYYFDACNIVWLCLRKSGMKNPALWRLLNILHQTGKDFALTLEQYQHFSRKAVGIYAYGY